MPPAKATPLLDPIRLGADWIQDFLLTIDSETQAENITNVSVAVNLAKREPAGVERARQQVTSPSHITVYGEAGRIAMRVPASEIADWAPGLYDVEVVLTWPNETIDTALIAAVKVEEGLAP